MKPEQQVCSLHLAKKLKELGAKQESYFYWHNDGSIDALHPTQVAPETVYSAFTVAELGEMLPRLTNCRIWQQHSTDTSKIAGKWAVTVNDVRDDKFDEVTADTEADARAKMLIYLLENYLIPKE